MKYTHLLFYFFLAIIFTSCSEDCDKDIVERPSDPYQYILPYKGFDTMVFIHNSFDTLTYIGRGITYFEDKKRYGTDENCTRVYEGLKQSFYCAQNSSTIHFTFSPYSISEGYKYYYNNSFVGGILIYPPSTDSVLVGNKYYRNYFFWSDSQSKTQYFMINVDNSINAAIIKIQYPGDTLTLLK